MAGIYFHIPFCKQACHYCDFHFSTSLKKREALLLAMEKELQSRSAEFRDEVSTIYFGGGTPSLLTQEELQKLLDQCREHYNLRPDLEVCLEANPDDLDPEKLAELKDIGVERLSIGVQSFSDEKLNAMNRAHSASESQRCVEDAQAAGFKNLSIDLIYAQPDQSEEEWQQELETAVGLQVQHISAYCLTVEKGTALHHFVKQGKVVPATSELEQRQFQMAIDCLTKAGFDHYEISNFGLPGFWSRHNTSYWQGAPYLGIGPSAHSYNGRERRWNVANNARYLKALEQGSPYYETERLSGNDRFNEAIMLGLRTSWGVDLVELAATTGLTLDNAGRAALAERHKAGYLRVENDHCTLTDKGKAMADRIAAELFLT